jgi:hypothetical protein
MDDLRRFTAFGPREAEAPRSLHQRAAEDLGFIRATMERAAERAASYTAIPGWGGVLMGVSALVATPFAILSASREHWFATWMAAAAVAGSIGAIEMLRKAKVERVSLLSGAGSRFALALAPGLVAGVLLTIVLNAYGLWHLLPGVWLLLYGVAVRAAGVHSIRAVRSMGLAFMLVGAVALCGLFFAANASAFGDLCMASGFGLLHVMYGLEIAREHRG